MYTLLLALIYVSFISLGLPDSLLGAGWSVMHTDMKVSVSSMGIVSMIISGGTIVSSLLSDRLTHRFGTRTVTTASVFLTAFALFGFGVSKSFASLLIFALPYGLGAGAVDAALNNYVALHYTSRHMSWLHCFWGVGAIISPLVMGFALENLTWRGGYFIVGGLQLAIGALLLSTLRFWRVHPSGDTRRTKSIGLAGALKTKGVPFILLSFLAYCAAEATAMHWASTYFVQVKGLAAEQAARFGSLIYIGITVGRFICGFVSDRLGDRRMIALGACVLFCGIGLMALPSASAVPAVVGFAVIGFGCAPIYPCIIHSTPSRFGAERSGAIIGVQMASAYIGSTFMPPLYGLLGDFFGFELLPAFLAAFFALMIVMSELTFRCTRDEQQI